MRNMPTAIHKLLLAAGLALCTAASASVDTSPKPGGPFKLKPGTYVANGLSCEAPPNGAIRRYDGEAIVAVHSAACKTRIRARHGNRYAVDQRCVDTRGEPGRRRLQKQTIQVRDALSFTQSIGGDSVSYRYCPAYQLPPKLRQQPR
jgi:hypothetical protein